MKLKKLLCLGFDGSELEKIYWQELDGLTKKLILAVDNTEIIKNTDAEGLFVKLGTKINKNFIDKFPNLKYIGMLGTGYEGIDTYYSTSKGIAVTNIADYATESVAEFTFGILLEYLRDITKARTQAKSGNYSDNFIGSEIKNKKIGVIGLGNIGKRIAQIGQAFGAEVYYWSRRRKVDMEKKGISYVELDDLLANSDILTLNLALNPETLGIINTKKLNLIKKNCMFINISPMELINFNALLEYLKKKEFTFILDHSYDMPKKQLKILQHLDNVIVYPSIAYLSEEAGQLKKRIYVDNLKNFLDGKPTNKVN